MKTPIINNLIFASAGRLLSHLRRQKTQHCCRTFQQIITLYQKKKKLTRLLLFAVENLNQCCYKIYSFRDIYLTFEYMDTDLHNVIKRGTILKDIHRRYIMCQLFRAVRFLHSGNVLHR